MILDAVEKIDPRPCRERPVKAGTECFDLYANASAASRQNDAPRFLAWSPAPKSLAQARVPAM
ncbi:hypothetical protein [Nonomuraea sp. NPDC003201]